MPGGGYENKNSLWNTEQTNTLVYQIYGNNVTPYLPFKELEQVNKYSLYNLQKKLYL